MIRRTARIDGKQFAASEFSIANFVRATPTF
jgi:hypothetical protein